VHSRRTPPTLSRSPPGDDSASNTRRSPFSNPSNVHRGCVTQSGRPISPQSRSWSSPMTRMRLPSALGRRKELAAPAHMLSTATSRDVEASARSRWSRALSTVGVPGGLDIAGHAAPKYPQPPTMRSQCPSRRPTAATTPAVASGVQGALRHGEDHRERPGRRVTVEALPEPGRWLPGRGVGPSQRLDTVLCFEEHHPEHPPPHHRDRRMIATSVQPGD
jgi:hypothetical protein